MQGLRTWAKTTAKVVRDGHPEPLMQQLAPSLPANGLEVVALSAQKVYLLLSARRIFFLRENMRINHKLGLIVPVIVAFVGCKCPSEKTSSVEPEPVKNKRPPTEERHVLELLPEYAVFNSEAGCVVINSKARAQEEGREWKIPYPYTFQEQRGVDCGFFPTLQGRWRTAYCLEEGKREPRRFYIEVVGDEYVFTIGGWEQRGYHEQETECQLQDALP